ncbi:peptidase S41 [bacterium]|nr:peptidase S41 [bacterium]
MVAATRLRQLTPSLQAVTLRNGHSQGDGPLTLLANAHPAVREALAGTVTLTQFRKHGSVLSRGDKLRLIEQAQTLFEQNYVHLPLKEKMHAVNPRQRLLLLEHQVRNEAHGISSDLEFHRQITEIFMSVRDLHTNYILPTPFSQMVAFLPFLVESYHAGGARCYLVSHVANGYQQTPFGRGVDLLNWNGVPIERAVEINGNRYAGSNLDARRARGLATMTQRPLLLSLPPDEDWVQIGYRTEDGAEHELRIPWLVTSYSQAQALMGELDASYAAAVGLDLEIDTVNQFKKLLFAPLAVAAEQQLERNLARGTVGNNSPVPSSVIDGWPVDTATGRYAYIRLRTFSIENVDALLARFIELVESLPQDGLILDVRDNGGGIIMAGERLLQLLTPHRIEPARFQFINTPLNLRICKRQFFLQQWVESIEESVRTGAVYSAGFPITPPEDANDVGQHYHGPVVLITNAICYSTTDIFAAGFQDHEIGRILGVDGNTGAGGANVWTHELLRQFLGNDEEGSPYLSLPNNASMRVSVRRTLRVGKRAGTPVEDLGVIPDHLHELTRNDLLTGNVDLIEHAGELLGSMRQRQLQVSVQTQSADGVVFNVSTLGIDRLDIYVNERPQGTIDLSDGETELSLSTTNPHFVELQGFESGLLVAARRMQL